MLDLVWQVLKYYTGAFTMFYLGVWVGISAVDQEEEEATEGIAALIAYTGLTVGGIVLVLLWLYYGVMVMV